MVKETSLADELASVAGREHVSEAAADYALDGTTPRIAVAPGSYEEVAAVLRYANAGGLALIPRGGGTRLRAGNLPARYDIALALGRLAAVVEHEPADLTITCQAGITLGALRRHLAGAGQLVALDPALPDEATVGGILATNAYGPARLAYGTPRDFTIGMRVVTAGGRITRAGGKVVKNVAGYDLCKLYIGSFGTLGVIVEATFKVLPQPRTVQHLTFAFAGPDDACGAASRMYMAGLSLRAMALANDGAGWLLSLDLAGCPRGVARSADDARTIALAATGAPGDPPPAPQSATENDLVMRGAVLPSELPGVLRSLGAALPAGQIVAYPTLGAARITVAGAASDRASVDRARTLTGPAGTLVVEQCSQALKAEIEVFGEAPEGIALMRRLKEQFDPNAVLSPGRFVGRI